HDDRARELRHDAAKGLQAVETGHLYIKGDNIGAEGSNFLQGLRSTDRGSNYPEVRIGNDQVGERRTHEGAVVHNEHPYWRLGRFEAHARYMARTRLGTSSI